MEKCNSCDLYKDGHCTKFRKNGKCEPSTSEWLIRDEYDTPMEYIPTDKMCRYGSIFGNDYIGLSQNDIDRIKNGEVIYISGEYGIFIGFITDEEKRRSKDGYDAKPIADESPLSDTKPTCSDQPFRMGESKGIDLDSINIDREMEILKRAIEGK